MKKSYLFLSSLLITFTTFYSINNVFAGEKEYPWIYPKDSEISKSKNSEMVKYGKALITETYKYLGPDVKDPKMRFAGNHLSCKNCHLNAGTKENSGGYVGVIYRYPQFRARLNKISTIEDRVNDCMERSLNGKHLEKESKEMKAIVSYMTWLSSKIPEGTKKVKGQGFVKLPLLDRAASPEKGKQVFLKNCMACHGIQGQGLKSGDGKGYLFPPLWGKDSFNNGAGMHRLLTASAFIKSNMPLGTANLSVEDAYDVASYINSQERPIKKGLEKDYPNLKIKQVDAPYPPFGDKFSLEKHKYGPYKDMIKEKK